MKKLVLIATMAATLSGLSSFGQGLFNFTGPVKGVWDLWSTSTARVTGQTNNVGFAWGTGTPSVEGIMATVPTNNATAYSYATAWSDILNDPNFTIAVNATNSAVVVTPVAANGAWSYLSGGSFPVSGTSASGGTTTVYVFAWDKAYATPSAAALAGAAVGWGATFSYAYAASAPPGTPTTMSTLPGNIPFGVGAVPEPSTFALAGLGAAALMIFRRKK